MSTHTHSPLHLPRNALHSFSEATVSTGTPGICVTVSGSWDWNLSPSMYGAYSSCTNRALDTEGIIAACFKLSTM